MEVEILYITPSSGVAHPKFGGETFGFRRITPSCLGYRLSKHKMTIYVKKLGGTWPSGYAYDTRVLNIGL